MSTVHHAWLVSGLVVGAVVACRGEPPHEDPSGRVQHLVDSLAPLVEDAVGLEFTMPPVSAIRTPEQVRAYVVAKLNQELPPEKLVGIQTAYRLFGLLPDTLELGPVIVELLAQQVVGFYDPDSSMLFVVEGSDPLQVRLVVAHELVHALQGQHLPLSDLLKAKGFNDQSMATQSILEGQANYASLALFTGPDAVSRPEFWEEVRRVSRSAQGSLPPGLPTLLREWLIFPYVGGGEFMRWWESSPLADTVPFGPRMPTSTEQILHPTRYARGDHPFALVFTDATADVAYEDELGEFEIRILQAELAGGEVLASALPLGWAGDRYRLFDSPDGPALVWYTVWDAPVAAQRFMRATAQPFLGRGRPGYRLQADSLSLDGKAAVRIVVAPTAWPRWRELPQVRVRAPA